MNVYYEVKLYTTIIISCVFSNAALRELKRGEFKYGTTPLF